MEYENIIVEKADRVARITLNRPQVLNAISVEMWREIGDALDDIEQNDDILSVVVVTGKGRVFSAGADLKLGKEFAGDANKMRNFIRLVQKTLDKIENLSKPVVAAVNGVALAGGFEITLACDIVIALEGARLDDQHAHYSLVPGSGGLQRTP